MATRKVTSRKRVRRGVAVTTTKAMTTKAEARLAAVRSLMIRQEALAVSVENAKEELEKILKDNPQLKESDFLLPR